MSGTRKISAFLAFCLIFVTVSEAMTLMKAASELRCQCVATQSTFIHPRLYQSVELIPSGPHCKNVELIITITTGEAVCVDPSAPWVERIIKKILESKENTEEPTI
ncbi:interleukin-8-like [Pelobates fuscus]|uniref:interleukin-8-like n=1 Tax=Pelobates fuscus TaxID=191477 RepID=UPI002FE4589E